MFDQAVLDTFNRTNEAPIANPWKTTNSLSGRLVSNQYAGSASNSTWAYNRYEGAGPYTDCEAYATLATHLEWHVVAARMQSTTSPTGHRSGYFAQYAATQYYVILLTNSVQVTYVGPFNVTLASGDKIGIRAIGSAIQGWYYKAGAWTLAGTLTDSTYASGYLGLAMSTTASATTGRMDDFGGGAPITASTFIPQIIVS